MVSGLFDYMRKGGGSGSIEVSLGDGGCLQTEWMIALPAVDNVPQAPEAELVAWISLLLLLLQVSRLQKNVDDLQHALLKSLHDRQPTVIYTGNNGKSG